MKVGHNLETKMSCLIIYNERFIFLKLIAQRLFLIAIFPVVNFHICMYFCKNVTTLKIKPVYVDLRNLSLMCWELILHVYRILNVFLKMKMLTRCSLWLIFFRLYSYSVDVAAHKALPTPWVKGKLGSQL